MSDEIKQLAGVGLPFYSKIRIITKTSNHDYITEIPIGHIKMWDYTDKPSPSITIYLSNEIEFKLNRPEAKMINDVLNSQFYNIAEITYTLP